METVVDSSVLVAAFNEKDSLHERALKAMDECRKPFVLHEYVMLETVTVLMTRVDKQTADSFLRSALTNAEARVLFSSTSGFLDGAQTFMENRTKLSFTDATLLALSQEYTVLTFDQALVRAIKRREAR